MKLVSCLDKEHKVALESGTWRANSNSTASTGKWTICPHTAEPDRSHSHNFSSPPPSTKLTVTSPSQNDRKPLICYKRLI